MHDFLFHFSVGYVHNDARGAITNSRGKECPLSEAIWPVMWEYALVQHEMMFFSQE